MKWSIFCLVIGFICVVVGFKIDAPFVIAINAFAMGLHFKDIVQEMENGNSNN